MLATLAASDHEVCVCDFTDALPLNQPTVSHHLRILREASLITCERSGTWVYISSRATRLTVLAMHWESFFERKHTHENSLELRNREPYKERRLLFNASKCEAEKGFGRLRAIYHRSAWTRARPRCGGLPPRIGDDHYGIFVETSEEVERALSALRTQGSPLRSNVTSVLLRCSNQGVGDRSNRPAVGGLHGA